MASFPLTGYPKTPMEISMQIMQFYSSDILPFSNGRAERLADDRIRFLVKCWCWCMCVSFLCDLPSRRYHICDVCIMSVTERTFSFKNAKIGLSRCRIRRGIQRCQPRVSTSFGWRDIVEKLIFLMHVVYMWKHKKIR